MTPAKKRRAYGSGAVTQRKDGAEPRRPMGDNMGDSDPT